MFHIEVYLIFQFPIQINWIQILICMQRSAIKSLISRKDRVVSVYCCFVARIVSDFNSAHFFLAVTQFFLSFIDVCFYFPTCSLAASSNVKKQISVSQHSSISQADDCSSPYARVRSQTHAYDKVRPAEHPYAQVKSINDNGNRPSTSGAAATSNNLNAENDNNPNDNDSLSRRSSRESLLDSVDGRQHPVSLLLV